MTFKSLFLEGILLLLQFKQVKSHLTFFSCLFFFMYNVVVYAVIAQTQNLKMPKYLSHLSTKFTNAINHTLSQLRIRKNESSNADQI